MSVNDRTTPVADLVAMARNAELLINVYPEGNSCVVHVTGELDLASRNQLFVAFTAGNHPAMVIDLAGVTFMDCSGYRCLVAARLVIEQGGRSLIVRGATGQPARLLDLIAKLQRTGVLSPQRSE